MSGSRRTAARRPPPAGRRGWARCPALAQDRDQRGVARATRCRRPAGRRSGASSGMVSSTRLASPCPERHQPHQVADADRLLDQRGQQPRRRDGDVDAPGLVEQPLVLRVVDPGHRRAAPRTRSWPAATRPGSPCRRRSPRSPPGSSASPASSREVISQASASSHSARGTLSTLMRLGSLVDEQHLVTVLEQLAGDGPADAARSGDGDPHQCSLPAWRRRTPSSRSRPRSLPRHDVQHVAFLQDRVTGRAARPSPSRVTKAIRPRCRPPARSPAGRSRPGQRAPRPATTLPLGSRQRGTAPSGRAGAASGRRSSARSPPWECRAAGRPRRGRGS